MKGFKGSTTDIDRGYKDITRNLEKLKNKPYVKVGVLEKSGQHEGLGDLTVADVATFHEFGTEGVNGQIVPQRPFIRNTVDENTAELTRETEALRKQVIFFNLSVFKALSLLGLRIQKLIQSKITDGDSSWPALKQSTIDAKGSDKPLIDTGQLRRSISYEVVEKG